MILVKGTPAAMHTFWQRFAASHEQVSHKWFKCLSGYEEMLIIGLIKSPENICLKTCPVSFSKSTSVSFLFSTLNSFQRILNVSSCSSTWFIPCRGSCQVPIFSWHFFFFPSSFLPSSPSLTLFLLSAHLHWVSLLCKAVSNLMDIAGYSGRLIKESQKWM